MQHIAHVMSVGLNLGNDGSVLSGGRLLEAGCLHGPVLSLQYVICLLCLIDSVLDG